MRIFKRITKKNLKEYKMELMRAHLMIAMLSIAVITLLSLGIKQSVTYDMTLSAVCVVLLIIVTILSLCTAVYLYRSK